MINNKQINVWRGTNEPPTIYHVWIYDMTKMLLHNGTEWVVFIDDLATVDRIEELLSLVANIDDKISDIENYTVNEIPIKENPVLTGENIVSKTDGHFIKNTDSVKDSLLKLDILLTTQILQ